MVYLLPAILSSAMVSVIMRLSSDKCPLAIWDKMVYNTHNN